MYILLPVFFECQVCKCTCTCIHIFKNHVHMQNPHATLQNMNLVQSNHTMVTMAMFTKNASTPSNAQVPRLT